MEEGKDSDVRQKDGKNLEMAMYYDKGSSSQKEQAEYLQAEFKKMGIKLNINGETSDKIAERRTSGDYDLMFNQTWGLLYDPQSTIAAFKAKMVMKVQHQALRTKIKYTTALMTHLKSKTVKSVQTLIKTF